MGTRANQASHEMPIFGKESVSKIPLSTAKKKSSLSSLSFFNVDGSVKSLFCSSKCSSQKTFYELVNVDEYKKAVSKRNVMFFNSNRKESEGQSVRKSEVLQKFCVDTFINASILAKNTINKFNFMI